MERKDSIKIRVTRKRKLNKKLNFTEMIAPNLIKVVDANKMTGIIDIEGNVIVPCDYSSIGTFSEGLVAVRKNGLWGYINKNGIEVIPCRYNEAYDFSEGLAAVRVGWSWSYIDKNGKLVTEFGYDKVQDFNRGLACVQKKGLWYCIDRMGKIIIDASMIEYDREITEELYIENEKDIPDNCTSIEMLSYKSLFVLNNGDRIEIEFPNREEWGRKVEEMSEEKMTHLENSVKNTPLTKKLTK